MAVEVGCYLSRSTTLQDGRTDKVVAGNVKLGQTYIVDPLDFSPVIKIALTS